MQASTKIWKLISKFIFLFALVVAPSMGKPNPDNPTTSDTTECSICGHDLQKLTLSLNTWAIVMKASLSAEKHGYVLDLNENEFSNKELIGKWDQEATQDECHKNLAKVKNALWDTTLEVISPNVDLLALTYVAHQLPPALRDFNKHRKDNAKWTLYEEGIRPFLTAIFQKYEILVGKQVVEILKSGTKSTEDASNMVKTFLNHNMAIRIGNFVQQINLTSDVIQEKVIDIFRKNSDVNKELTERVLEFGALTWPENTADFYKKIVFKLSERV